MQHMRRQTTIALEWEEVKRTGKNLLEAYLTEGTREMIGVTRQIVLAKFAVIAFLAVALGLSLYGVVFELALVLLTNVLPIAAIEYARLVSHGFILATGGGVALILVRNVKSSER